MLAPIAPPGWKRRKTVDRLECKERPTARANASVSARATVVDVVGAAKRKDRSSGTGMGVGRRIEFAEGCEEIKRQVEGSRCAETKMRGS